MTNPNFLSFYQHYLGSLKRQGTEYKGICPFHPDNNPALSIKDRKTDLAEVTPRQLKYSSLPHDMSTESGPHSWSIFHCHAVAEYRYKFFHPQTFDPSFEEHGDK